MYGDASEAANNLTDLIWLIIRLLLRPKKKKKSKKRRLRGIAKGEFKTSAPLILPYSIK